MREDSIKQILQLLQNLKYLGKGRRGRMKIAKRIEELVKLLSIGYEIKDVQADLETRSISIKLYHLGKGIASILFPYTKTVVLFLYEVGIITKDRAEIMLTQLGVRELTSSIKGPVNRLVKKFEVLQSLVSIIKNSEKWI